MSKLSSFVFMLILHFLFLHLQGPPSCVCGSRSGNTPHGLACQQRSCLSGQFDLSFHFLIFLIFFLFSFLLQIGTNVVKRLRSLILACGKLESKLAAADPSPKKKKRMEAAKKRLEWQMENYRKLFLAESRKFFHQFEVIFFLGFFFF